MEGSYYRRGHGFGCSRLAQGLEFRLHRWPKGAMSRLSSTATARPHPDQRLLCTAGRLRSSSRRRSNINDYNSSFVGAKQQVDIPFAWEHLSGIPKTRKPADPPQYNTNDASTTSTKSSKSTRKLPLPPAGPHGHSQHYHGMDHKGC